MHVPKKPFMSVMSDSLEEDLSFTSINQKNAKNYVNSKKETNNLSQVGRVVQPLGSNKSKFSICFKCKLDVMNTNSPQSLMKT